MKQSLFILSAWFCLGISKAICAPVSEELVVSALGLEVAVHGVSTTVRDDVKDVIDMQIALNEDTVVTAPLADDLAFFLRQRYQELGYPTADVQWELVDGKVSLTVTEGVHYSVGAIRFEGASEVNEKELSDLLLRPTHEKLGTSGPKVAFVETDIKKGAELVQRYFQAQGYLEAMVESPEFTQRPEAEQVDVLIKIKQGRIFRFGEVTISGDLEGHADEVNEQSIGLTDQPYNEVKLEGIRSGIEGVFQRNGHFHAAVVLKADPAINRDGKVPVEFLVTPGPRFRISEVKISPSLSKGAQRVTRSSFKNATGRFYSPDELDIMHRRVLDTDIFSRLELKPVADGEDTLTLELSGEEGPTRRLAVFAGYETFQGPIFGVEARKMNLWNTGDALLTKVEVSGTGFNGAIKTVDPAFLNSPFNLDVELAAQSFSVFDYTRRTISLRSTLNRHWDRHITTGVFAEFSENALSSSALSPIELGPETYGLATVGAALTLDYRDSSVLPTKGYFASLTVTDATDIDSGGQVNYFRTDLAFSFYQPITKKLRAAFNARASAINITGGSEALPIDLRLFNGGATSVRSFPEREMGVKSKSGTPLGGTLSQLITIELSYEIISNLELAAFVDAGSVSPTRSNVLSSPSGLRYAVGAGIRYKLPIGPLRIDYGYNPSRSGNEPMGALHVALGFAF